MPGNREGFRHEAEAMCVQDVGTDAIQRIRKTSAAAFHGPRSIDIDEVVIDTIARQALRMRCRLQYRNPDSGTCYHLRNVRQRRPAFQQRFNAETCGRRRKVELRDVPGRHRYAPVICGLRSCTKRFAMLSSHGWS